MFDRVLMVCTGNICRSPMAQVLLADALKKRGIDVAVESAGLGALVGHPADPIAVKLMQARGLDLSGHRGRQLTREIIRSFPLILVMEKEQQRGVEQLDPSARGRVLRVGGVGNFDVPDPSRRGLAAFEVSLTLIDRGLSQIEKVFWSSKP
ncbi:MAG: low molecular weight protein-tyrosine-phosphatase [Myxococcales bacterium]